MTENPYQSPGASAGTARSESAPPRHGALAMTLWGLAIGGMGGGTLGGMAGGMLALASFCMSHFVSEPPGARASTLVVMMTAGTIAGAVVGAVTGSLFGPVVAVVARGCWKPPPRWGVMALSSTVLALVGGCAGWLGAFVAATPVPVVGALIGATTGLFGGLRLGHVVWELAQRRAAG